MKITDSYLTSFIRLEYPGFELSYSKTFSYGGYKFRLTGKCAGKKLKIFSHYTPTQLSKELDNGYKLILKSEGGVIVIDLKKVVVSAATE